MWVLPIVALVTCIAFALRGTRWAEAALRVSRWTYGLVMPLSFLYFPLHSGFHLRPVACEWTFDFALAIYSLRNTAHLVMFAIFFVITWAQLPNTKGATAWSLAVCFTIGFLVEIAEGATGFHHCRMRDMIPDMAGASLGALIVMVSRKIWALRSPARGAS